MEDFYRNSSEISQKILLEFHQKIPKYFPLVFLQEFLQNFRLRFLNGLPKISSKISSEILIKTESDKRFHEFFPGFFLAIPPLILKFLQGFIQKYFQGTSQSLRNSFWNPKKGFFDSSFIKILLENSCGNSTKTSSGNSFRDSF